jgi:GNAT superfamily N-acetyltransferase
MRASMQYQNMNIFIKRPQKKDLKEIHKVFSSVIQDAFRQDGIDDAKGIKEEVEKQLCFLQKDFESNGSEVYFLIAKTENQIIGTIAYTKANDLIKKNLKKDFSKIPEISSVYILPKFQGKGVGSLLFNAILLSLLHKNIDEVCLDGGYRKSQSYWIKKLGNPNVTLKDYWGKGLDHMIWVRKLKDLSIKY